MAESYGLHWFRRDLRVEGNPALEWSAAEHDGRVLGVFCFDRKFLSRGDFSPDRFAFFIETLIELRESLRERGGDLVVLDHEPKAAFGALFELLQKSLRELPATVSWNRDYEPFARNRDELMQAFFEKRGLTTHTDRDHLLIEPHEILKDDPKKPYYQVFTPFFKRWHERVKSSGGKARVSAQSHRAYSIHLNWDKTPQMTDLLELYRRENQKKVRVQLPSAGSEAARLAVADFSGRASRYDRDRDFPSINGTSHLSVFLKNGSLTTAQVLGRLNEAAEGQFLKELAWREFYYYVLFHFPNVEKEAFLAKYRNIEWENREDLFEAWKTGQTGYPIVDAGMRQLNQTGWMHNRVRMIVASFLTKDLLIDWRWGERYFMERLLDGDLAANNGGWQWAASTGCDPQPYFRVFNPTLQSKKFDPDGEYIRQFVPELAKASRSEVHAPKKSIAGYPKPVVDHSLRRVKALSLYRKAR